MDDLVSLKNDCSINSKNKLFRILQQKNFFLIFNNTIQKFDV